MSRPGGAEGLGERGSFPCEGRGRCWAWIEGRHLVPYPVLAACSVEVLEGGKSPDLMKQSL